jgi:Spy/CpxP family protein refolding chaperone
MFRSAKMLVAGLSLATLVFAAPVRAEDKPAGGEKPAKKEGAQRMGGPADRLQKQLDALNLTDDQKAKVNPIIEKLKTDAKAVMDGPGERKDKAPKLQELAKQAMTDIEAVLTPEQKAQLEKAKEEAKAKRGAAGDKGGAKKGGDKPAN